MLAREDPNGNDKDFGGVAMLLLETLTSSLRFKLNPLPLTMMQAFRLRMQYRPVIKETK
jgi:hypothetical protein